MVKPETIVPGVANYYASTVYDGHDFASVLVKTREGRPIKLEPNKTSTNARVQASVLSLYDSSRLKNPYKNGLDSDWETVDNEIKSKLEAISKEEGKIVLLSSSIISPTTEQIINSFSKKYSNFQHIQMDSISSHGALEANLETFGVRALPSYYFDKADVIVSFGADFIGNWGSPNNERDYFAARNPNNGSMSKHYQIETTLTLTGSNADERIQIKPFRETGLLSSLYSALNGSKPDYRIVDIVSSLKKAKSSIVVCNSNKKEVQLLVNSINEKLGNYNNTIDMNNPSYLRKGNDNEVKQLLSEMNEGKVQALITYNTNPSYTLSNAKDFNKGLEKVNLKISTALSMDETSSNMDYVCPDSHNLESWGDANPTNGEYTLMQPTINPLFNTRQFQDTMLKWMSSTQKYYDLLKNSYSDWDSKLHDGYFTTQKIKYLLKSNFSPSFVIPPPSDKIEFEISEKISMGDGSQSNNPWLQELPDPLSRACWDNYLTISA